LDGQLIATDSPTGIQEQRLRAITMEGRLAMEGPINDPSLGGSVNPGSDEEVDKVDRSDKWCRMDDQRILFAVDCEFPGQGGAEAQALKLAIEMRDRGAHVEFVTPRIFKRQPLEETFHGFTIRRIDYPHVRWIGSLVLMAYFARYLRKEAANFDALHVHITHLMAATAGFVRKQTGLPVTTKISGFYEFEGGVLDQKKKYKPLNYLLRFGLKKVDFVQTISEQTREKLLAAEFRNDQIRFIPNGIDTGDKPQLRAIEGTVVFGYCGRLREVKGVHVLLDALAKARQRRPELDLKVVVAGSGTSADDLRAQAEMLGITEHVEWLGLIEDTQAFLRSLDIYVQPSFAEGLPNSVMEAMVEQLPVIATDIGGNNDLIEHETSGLLFPAGDSDALVDCLFKMIDGSHERQEMAKKGRSFIENRYDIKQVVNQLSELYRV